MGCIKSKTKLQINQDTLKVAQHTSHRQKEVLKSPRKQANGIKANDTLILNTKANSNLLRDAAASARNVTSSARNVTIS